MKNAVVILAHGSRKVAWEANQLVLQIAEKYRAKTGNENVKAAYMNSLSGGPGLKDVVAEFIQDGFTEIIVAPWFLTNGLHIQEDIPEMIESLKQKHPQVNIKFAQVLGADERIVDILIDRVEEAE